MCICVGYKGILVLLVISKTNCRNYSHGPNSDSDSLLSILRSRLVLQGQVRSGLSALEPEIFLNSHYFSMKVQRCLNLRVANDIKSFEAKSADFFFSPHESPTETFSTGSTKNMSSLKELTDASAMVFPVISISNQLARLLLRELKPLARNSSLRMVTEWAAVGFHQHNPNGGDGGCTYHITSFQAHIIYRAPKRLVPQEYGEGQL